MEDYGSGGVDRIINLAKNVSKHEVNVYLIDRSLKKSLFSLILDNDKYYQIKSGIVKECDYPLHIRFLFPGLIKLAQEILNRITSLLFSTLSVGSLSYVLDPYLIVKSYFVCRKERVDLIQCEFPTTAPPSFVVKKLLNIPLIYDAHNAETELMRSLPNVSRVFVVMTKLVENMSCMMCDLIFVVSERDKEQLASFGIPENKIEVIPNSVEVNRYLRTSNGKKVRNKYKLNNRIVMIFHGNLGYAPNEEAVRILTNDVLPNILEKHPDVFLLLVGRNPPKIHHPNIIVTGFVENLPEYIAAADIALVPLLKGGGTRIKILEYMACGKAVVSTVKGAEGLNVQNGRDILMTANPDSKFIDLVLKLIKDGDLRKRIGTNARRNVGLFYEWEETAKKAVQSYNKLVCLSGKKRGKIHSARQENR
ncbi:MAG: glycosyltransferase family 4 protein [Candidatus Bathyarchaeia archaeon]